MARDGSTTSRRGDTRYGAAGSRGRNGQALGEYDAPSALGRGGGLHGPRARGITSHVTEVPDTLNLERNRDLVGIYRAGIWFRRGVVLVLAGHRRARAGECLRSARQLSSDLFA